MRMVIRFAAGLLILAVLVALAGLFLPRHLKVERSVEVAAAPAEIYPHVVSLKAFNIWSPWSEIDPETVYQFSGPETGVGAVMEWESSHMDVGSGRQEIVEAVPDRLVRTALDFGAQGMAMAFWRLDPVGAEEDAGITTVTWGLSTDLGYNPLMRYLGLLIETEVGRSYETGLARLKTLVETGHSQTEPGQAGPAATGTTTR